MPFKPKLNGSVGAAYQRAHSPRVVSSIPCVGGFYLGLSSTDNAPTWFLGTNASEYEARNLK